MCFLFMKKTEAKIARIMKPKEEKKVNRSKTIGLIKAAIPRTKQILVMKEPKISPNAKFLAPARIDFNSTVSSGIVVPKAITNKPKTKGGMLNI